ncbi:MAG: hypothetical protein NXI12_06980 [Alphaproteobacteria bacterium]|nr:hypothetical protein [Alphaproteobacteria bacterium]
MTLIRILSALGGLILAAAIVWAILTAGQSLSEAVAWLTSEPWGVVSLIDLYLGFFLIGVAIWLFEPNKAIAVAFIAPLPFLGNVWAAIWFAWRIAAVLRARQAGA